MYRVWYHRNRNAAFNGVSEMIKALVFDFDGLMVDTESSAYDSWQEIYQEYGYTLPLEQWALVLGGSGAEFDLCAYLANLCGQALDHDALRARRSQRKLVLVADEPLLPGIREAIDAARHRGLKLGVASSSSRRWVVSHLDRLGVTSLFDTIVCADDVAHVKPAPDLYRTAIARLGALPHEAVAIEDALNGLRAAKAAGLKCVVVPNKFLRDGNFEDADLRLESFADMSLEQLLTQINDEPSSA
jgi:HAD superfamily hydrolase (TIGR01509 family)